MTTHVLFLSALALFLAMSHVTAYTCDSNPYVNGCSIPRDLPYFYKDVFTPACNKHDVCYNCGQAKGVSRASCDRRFKANIRQICSSDSRVSFDTWCRMVSFDYYIAVRVGGSGHYLSTSPSWCSDSWVNSCM